MGSVKRSLRVSEIQVDPSMWGPNAQPRVRSWLLEHYNPRTMPPLMAAEIVGKEGSWLLGWNHEGTNWPPLMALIFGQSYSDNRLALNNMSIRLQELIDAHGVGQYGAKPNRKED